MTYPAGPPSPTAGRRGSATPWIVAVVAVVVAIAAVVWGITRPSGDRTGATPDPPTSAPTTVESSAPDSSADEPGAAATGLDVAITELSFATPEEAVQHVGTQLAAGDVTGALQAYATTSAADNWNHAAYLDRMKAVAPQALPDGANPLYRDAFLTRRLAESTQQFQYLIGGLTLPDWLSDTLEMRTVVLDGEYTGADVVEALDVDLSSLAVVEVAEARLSQEPQYQETAAKMIESYGADEQREFGVLWEFDGETYYGGATVVRYDDDWKIWTMNSALLNVPTSGVLTPTTAEEFAGLVG